jgi:hypothetical protein
MRSVKFAPNECYHIHGRGVLDHNIFQDEHDLSRFLFLILHFQSPTVANNVYWSTQNFLKKGTFGLGKERSGRLEEDRSIHLMAFSITKDGFHILVQNLEDQAVSVYMHRVLMAYSKYFNAKYKKRGHVFNGPFRAKHIETNPELLFTSAFIHKRPGYNSKNKTYSNYKFSSLQDYTGENRWGNLLKNKLIIDQYKSPKEYKNFVETSKTGDLGELF